MKNEQFSPVDAAWLHMDKPTNLAVIVGVMMFDAPLDFERFRAVVTERLLIYDRFKQRVREPLLGLGLPTWEVDPQFDLDYHVPRVTLAAPGDEAALQQLAGEMMSEPLDRHHPLWQFIFVDHYGTGSAIIGRLHHCIADGLALVQVLLSMTDPTPDADWHAPESKPVDASIRNFLRPAVKAVNATLATAGSLLHEGLLTVAHPSRVIDAINVGALGAMALSKLLLLKPDQPTLFRGQCGVTKRAVWSKPMPLGAVKDVAHALNATLNDVLLAAVAGALRRYLEERGEVATNLNMRAMVPVSVRPSDKLNQLGNQFGLVILSLPVGLREPLRRLGVLKERMDQIKDTPEALVAFGLLGGMGVSPTQIEDVLLKFFAAKVSAVMTNVPGPRTPIYLTGVPMNRIMSWVPTPGNLSLGVSIISYAGEVMVGIATDAGLAPDPDRIVDAFNDEFAYLQTWAAQSVTAVEPVAAMHNCHALTKSGKPCKNRVLPNSQFCRVHQRA
ncbi:MAG TPA: wax ester/triacylglycerol synthase family O-acyltransferase [Anaerolineae bacterium]|nr:wax ester/triacylglycerol synthase family O-acyltransferase [Anaerolineae bacterium]